MNGTLNTAGFAAIAGAARPGAAASCAASLHGHGPSNQNLWTMGAAYVKPTTFGMIQLTDRPSRRLQELSP
jgi:hypothetical protein